MNLLLEIGCEEIPDWMLAGALEYLGGAVGELTKNLRTGDPLIQTDATARRLVVRAEGLIPRQPDSEERVWGPAKSAPAPAVAGFAKKQGVEPGQLEILSDGKAEKYSYVRKTPGRATAEILAEALPQLILKTPFPKTMLWPGKGGARFIRPIRWVVALLDNQVIPFEIADVKSGLESSGHRKLGAYRFPVTFENFEDKLRDNFVILSAEERKKRIRAVPTKYKCDTDLLNTLVNLTEWPTPITGSFDPAFLDLPGEVLTTVMKVHQKFFSVVGPDGKEGKLAPKFVAVTNTDGDPDGLIVRGNENVLRSRFKDAQFFWDSDQKRKLSDRVQDLANVTFQAKLGSYLEKTNRIVALVKELGGDAHAERAALLCKTDLTTELVKEFTELQGVIGGLYAHAEGEPDEVATAIYDHYKPVSMEDSIPRGRTAQLVAIADKLDSLRGCFTVGLIPSGSKDPFALRRAAQGIVKIIVDGNLRLPIRRLLGADVALLDFFFDRVRYYFRDIRGFKYDEVNAVLAAGSEDLVDIEERLVAVQRVRPTEDFEPLAASFKRISNILRQAGMIGDGLAVNSGLLEFGPEAALYEQFTAVSAAVRKLPDYATKLERIASLRPAVDLFFDKVMVNVENAGVRQNRLALLHSVLTEFSTIADFSEIVTTTQESK
jgi:glycyl-tRNA synthetase beta chain